MSSALVGRNIGELGKPQYKNSGPRGNIRRPISRGVVYYYCRKPGHVIRDCKKLQNRNQRFPSAHIASSNETFDRSVQFSADELARFHLYQESLNGAIVESCNPNTCFASSSSFEWVIDSRATYHMIGNSNLFSTFQSQPSTSTVTLANGSQCCVLGLGIIFPTSSIPLSFVLCLLDFSFNLVYVSKLTRALKCCVSFFTDFLLFQDLMTKQIIGRGHESRGLYILDPAVPRLIACYGVTKPFETRCRLGHPSLPLLKKLCPQFSSLPS